MNTNSEEEKEEETKEKEEKVEEGTLPRPLASSVQTSGL